MDWRNKAHRIIEKECRSSWKQANTNRRGGMRKRHVPYRVPESAAFLIDCLDRNDEEAAKAHFLVLNALSIPLRRRP